MRTTSAFKTCITTSALCVTLVAGLLAAGCSASGDAKPEESDSDNGFHLVKESYYFSNTGETQETFYDYDDSDRIIRKVERYESGNTNIYNYQYIEDDKQINPLVEDYYPNGSIYMRIEKVYNDNDELVSTKTSYFDSLGNQTSLSVLEDVRDDEGNIAESVLYEGTDEDSLEVTKRFTTDIAIDEDGTEQRTEYVNGEVTQINRTKKDAEGRTILYEHEEPDGDYIYKEYEYFNGEVSHEIEVVRGARSDNCGRDEKLAHFDEQGHCVFLEYLGDNNVPGDGTYYAYDDDGNVIQAATVESRRITSETSYVYDNYGNLLTKWTWANNDNGLYPSTKRTTYEYVNDDMDLRISGSEYDMRKYVADYADNHPLNQLLIDIDDIYEQYGSTDIDGGLGIDYTLVSADNNPLAFDESIKCSQKINENLVVTTDSYECELPSAWAKDIEVTYEGPLKNDCVLSYRSSFSKEPYRLLTISYSEVDPDSISDAGDVGTPLAWSVEEDEYLTHLDVFAVSYPFRFWYQAHGGTQDNLDGLEDSEKQEILNLLFDDTADLSEILSADDFDASPYIEFDNYSWLQCMKSTMKIKQ